MARTCEMNIHFVVDVVQARANVATPTASAVGPDSDHDSLANRILTAKSAYPSLLVIALMSLLARSVTTQALCAASAFRRSERLPSIRRWLMVLLQRPIAIVVALSVKLSCYHDAHG